VSVCWRVGFPVCCFPPVLFPPVVFPPCGVWLGLCVGRVDPALAFIRWQLGVDREVASAGATANTTVKNSRASRESGLLCSHSHGESIAPSYTRVQRSEKQGQLDQEEHEIETDYVCECIIQLQLQITKSQTNNYIQTEVDSCSKFPVGLGTLEQVSTNTENKQNKKLQITTNRGRACIPITRKQRPSMHFCIMHIY